MSTNNFYKCKNLYIDKWVSEQVFRSKYCKISRSMRQVCPVSPLLYIIQAERLASAIRSNNNLIRFPLPYRYMYLENDKPAEAKIV